MKKGGYFALLLTGLVMMGNDQVSQPYGYHEEQKIIKKRIRKKYPPRFGPVVGKFIQDVLYDAAMINYNLISWDSFKVITAVFPFFIGARMIDDRMHHIFYDPKHHRNINQMPLPSLCEGLAEFSIAAPIVFFGLQMFFSKSHEIRETNKVFLVGMPFVIWSKEIIKQFRFDACLRPWREEFSCKKRSFGGLPSGHLAETTYTAVLYGMRYGPRFGVPLGVLALGVGITFLSCNRHYASQMVAGAGVGAMYALAANKLINSNLEHNFDLGMKIDTAGNPTFSVSWRF